MLWGNLDLNQGPTGYESAALTAELLPRKRESKGFVCKITSGFCFEKTGKGSYKTIFAKGEMRMWKFVFGVAIFLATVARGSEEIAQVCDPYCDAPRTRADNIPQVHLANMCDEYMTGYVQALIDMNYYEFQVRTIFRKGTVFVFNLPRNELISRSILCYIYDIPYVQCVERVNCCPQEFLCALATCDACAAEEIARSAAYLSLCSPTKCPQIKGIWLPQNTVLFQPLIADPRQVMNAAAIRFNDTVIGKHVGVASFGDEFILLRLIDVLWFHGDMDIGLEAGIFSVFDLDHIEACMVNTDFFVSALLTYALDRWSFRFRLWHMSSHLGDEFLLSNPGFCRRNLSDEGIDLFASYQMGQAVRVYGGAGYIVDRDKEFPEHPFYIEWGAEIRVFGARDCFNRLYVQPFLAMHFRSWEEHHFDLDQTYVLGVEWSKIQGIGRKFRIFLEYHKGFCREGQFARERSEYFAVKVNYGF